jgi:hypothetical protein
VIADVAGCNSVALAMSYHVSTYFLPHNPRRKLYYGEDGAIYFHPDESYYTGSRIRPRVSEVVTGPEYMPAMVEKMRARGLKFWAWLVYCYNHHLPAQFRDAAKHDAFGNPCLAQLCPASPDFRTYALGLTRDIVTNYKPDVVHLESLSYLHFRYGFRNPKVLVNITPFQEFLMGLCFCRHCITAADSAGMDGEAFKTDVADYLERELARNPTPEEMKPFTEETIRETFGGRLARYLDVRTQTATSLFLAAAQIVHDAGGRTSHAGLGDQWVNGLDSGRLREALDIVPVGIAGEAGELPTKVAEIREGLAPNVEVLADIRPANFTSKEEMANRLRALGKAGVDGFTFYNYGLIRREHLKWIGAAQDGP